MSERDDAPSGPLDVPTLEVLAHRGRSHPLVSGWAFRPDSISPRVLELHLDAARYPVAVDDARVDIRWFVGGDYTAQYLESRPNGTWQCRWDRHPKPDAPRAHFHPPPDASPNVVPSPVAVDHHLDLLFGVLEWIDERIAKLHR